MSGFGKIKRGLKARAKSAKSKASKLVDKVADKTLGGTQDTATGAQAGEIADARVGIVYFLGTCDLKHVPPKSTSILSALKNNYLGDTDGLKEAINFTLFVAKKIDNRTHLVEKLKGTAAYEWASNRVDDFKNTKFYKEVKNAVKKTAEAAGEIKDAIDSLMRAFSQWLTDKLNKMYGFMADLSSIIADIGMFLTTHFSKSLGDVVSEWATTTSVSGIISGAKKGIDGAKRIYQQYTSGRGVEILSGHPSMIANALYRHFAVMVAGGAKDIGLGIGSLAMAGAATPAAQKVYDLVVMILTQVCTLIDAFSQRFALMKILSKAREAWKAGGLNNPLSADGEKFNRWFRKCVVCTPVIAALVLSSGFVGHPVRFVQLLDPGQGDGGQAAFDAGVAHVERLKKHSAKYLQEYRDAYGMTFDSDDLYVKDRLKQVLTGKVMHDHLQGKVTYDV